jgi:hypothetical protein
MIKENIVEIKIHPSNYNKYYHKYGPFQCKDIIYVNISDLSSSSSVLVTGICEFCKKETIIKFYNYKKQSIGGYCCIDCSPLKVKKTNLERYGTECPLQNEQIIEKTKKSMLKNYGVDNISKLDSIKEDRRNNFKTEKFKNKSKITWLEKYGFDNPSKSDIIKIKKEETTLLNYGVKNPSQSLEIFEKSQISGKKIKLHECGLMYRGTYEKDFLDFCVSNNIEVEKGITLDYIYNGVKKYYHSDFFIPKLNMICEIKSSYYYDLYKDRNESKKEFTISKGYNFMFIINKNYEKIKKTLI